MGVVAGATYAGPLTTPSFLGCGAMWGNLSVWVETAPGSGTYKKVGDAGPAYGYSDGNGGCIRPVVALRSPTEANYRVFGQAGAIFTYEPVSLDLGPLNWPGGVPRIP